MGEKNKERLEGDKDPDPPAAAGSSTNGATAMSQQNTGASRDRPLFSRPKRLTTPQREKTRTSPVPSTTSSSSDEDNDKDQRHCKRCNKILEPDYSYDVCGDCRYDKKAAEHEECKLCGIFKMATELTSKGHCSVCNAAILQSQLAQQTKLGGTRVPGILAMGPTGTTTGTASNLTTNRSYGRALARQREAPNSRLLAFEAKAKELAQGYTFEEKAQKGSNATYSKFDPINLSQGHLFLVHLNDFLAYQGSKATNVRGLIRCLETGELLTQEGKVKLMTTRNASVSLLKPPAADATESELQMVLKDHILWYLTEFYTPPKADNLQGALEQIHLTDGEAGVYQYWLNLMATWVIAQGAGKVPKLAQMNHHQFFLRNWKRR